MSTTNSTAPAMSDEQLLEQLRSALAAAQSELAELEPKREQLSSRVASLEHTIAVYSGETPPAKRRAKRRAKAKPAAADAK